MLPVGIHSTMTNTSAIIHLPITAITLFVTHNHRRILNSVFLK